MKIIDNIMNYLPPLDVIKDKAIISSKIAVVALTIFLSANIAYKFGYIGMILLAKGHTIKAGFILGAATGVTIAQFFSVFPQLHPHESKDKKIILSMAINTDQNMEDATLYFAKAVFRMCVKFMNSGLVGAAGFGVARLAYNYFNRIAI